MAGGKRQGAGRSTVRQNGREWIRRLVEDPERRKKFEQALDAALEGWRTAKDPAAAANNAIATYLRAYEHAYGRPPQSLELNHLGYDGKDVRFVCTFEDGDPGITAPLSLPESAAE